MEGLQLLDMNYWYVHRKKAKHKVIGEGSQKPTTGRLICLDIDITKN